MIDRRRTLSWWYGAVLAGGFGLAGFLAGASAGNAAQPPGPPGVRGDRDGGGPPPPPRGRLLEALDRDGDGALSPEEIMKAPESLKTLDENKDGTLSADELRPPPGDRRRPPRPRSTPAPARDDGAAPRARSARRPGEDTVELEIRGGHETDPRDRGRPVALVAGGLGVTPEVFRAAFSRVRPAPAGTEPDRAQVRRNKAALMAALEPHGVTNDELDRVSNYYRYNPGRGESWPVKAATGYATFKEGVFSSVVITEHGSGYNSPPRISVPGHPELAFEAKLSFGGDLKKNGSIGSVARVGGAQGPK